MAEGSEAGLALEPLAETSGLDIQTAKDWTVHGLDGDGSSARPRGDAVRRVAQAIRSKRAERGWTQAKLAAKLGVSRGQVNRWEQGRLVPGHINRARLMRVLGPDGWPRW